MSLNPIVGDVLDNVLGSSLVARDRYPGGGFMDEIPRWENPMTGKFEPILVCKQKPLNVARLQDQDNGPKNTVEEPFYYVLDGHHRLEAAKRIGLRKVPVIRSEEAN